MFSYYGSETLAAAAASVLSSRPSSPHALYGSCGSGLPVAVQ